MSNYIQSNNPSIQEKRSILPHEATRSHHDPQSFTMSWWPAPDQDSNIEMDLFGKMEDEQFSSVKQGEAGDQDESILGRVEDGVWRLLFGAPKHEVAKKNSEGTNVENSTAAAAVSDSAVAPENVYHIVLTSSHFKKDVNSTVQGVRVCGSYTSLPAAKDAAHRALFDAGYEREWFTNFESQHGSDDISQQKGVVVQAVGPDGEIFTVSIDITPNLFHLQANDEGKIASPLYHVVQTVVYYIDDSSGQKRDTSIQGSFLTYDEARKAALSVLLSEEDGVGKDSYAEYDEAAPDELDCGYGENVIVHAAGQTGDNFLVSVLKSHELESVRIMDAARNMR